MRSGIDLTAENFLGSGHRQVGNVLAQGFAESRRFLFDLHLRRGHHLFRFKVSLLLGILDDTFSASLGIRNDFGGLILAFAESIRRALGCQVEALPATLSSRQSFGNLRGPFVERLDDRRPDKLHRKERKDDENCDLGE